MNSIVVFGNTVTMTSLELVDFINSVRGEGEAVLQHKHFLAKVPAVLGAAQSAKFSADYRDGRNRPQKCYRFPKREACLMAMSYSYELQAAVFDHMTMLEERLKGPVAQLPQDYITALEHLLEAKKSEQAAIAERDHAIATKAQIGSKREATAMAKASSAVREVVRLKEELGRNQQHATIIAVEKASGLQFGNQGFRPLKKWCEAHDVAPPKVPCPRYGKAVSWPADAWRDVYGVSLPHLFGEDARGM